jgi:hypothetical protein
MTNATAPIQTAADLLFYLQELNQCLFCINSQSQSINRIFEKAMLTTDAREESVLRDQGSGMIQIESELLKKATSLRSKIELVLTNHKQLASVLADFENTRTLAPHWDLALT